MLSQGHFTIRSVRNLGTGGLGTVDEVVVIASACNHRVGTHLARKRLNDKWKDKPEARERFEREIKAISRMSHGQIISFEGENLPNEERFYVMPLYPRSVRDYLSAHPEGVDWKSAASFSALIAGAMQSAHSMGYIHRDLKPENILLTKDNAPVISDWGLGYFVHRYSKVLDLTRGAMGTEYYCSLEQWNTGKCEASGDVYSLGVVVAELVRGRNRVRISPGMGINEDVVVSPTASSKEFNSFLKRMTSLEATRRPQTMEEVRNTLIRLAA